MNEYQYLDMAIRSKAALHDFNDLVFEEVGSNLVWTVRNSRAKKPACIVVSRGINPMAPSATLLISEAGCTKQLFPAGVDDGLEGAGAFTSLWVESQGRSLQV